MGTIRKAFEIYFNMLNHICIGIVAVHVTWYCIQMQLTGKFYIEYHLHVWLSTIGYQILMAEAILTLYSSNGWSFFHSPNTKKTLHWVLQVVGSVMAIAGTVILYPKRTKHFLSIHSITGLVSMILIVVSVINGILAHRRPSFYRKVKIRPVVFKIFHNFTGIATFVIGMVSLWYGYKYKYFNPEFGLSNVQIDFTPWLLGSVIFTLVMSLVGALIAFYSQTKIVLGL